MSVPHPFVGCLREHVLGFGSNLTFSPDVGEVKPSLWVLKLWKATPELAFYFVSQCDCLRTLKQILAALSTSLCNVPASYFHF